MGKNKRIHKNIFKIATVSSKLKTKVQKVTTSLKVNDGYL